MEADARIIIRSEWRTDPLDPGMSHTVPVAWSWEGGAVARLSRRALPCRRARVGQTVVVGPWRLTIVAEDVPMRGVFVTRRTRWAWWFIARWHGARAWQWWKARVIATCAIWGLGHYNWSAELQWTDIYAVAWLKRLIRGGLMPFKSKAQQRKLFATNPAVAKEFAKKTPKKAYKRLPEHVKKRK